MSLYKEIGGYFELEVHRGREYYPNAIALNSARNCLRYLIRSYGIQKLNVPAYTCPVVWQAAEAEGCKLAYYPINKHFMPAVEFAPDDYLLYTNYFGVCSENVRIMAQKYKNLIVDNSQSFYSGRMGLASFNSARKFLGVPDGAYLFTECMLSEELEDDVSVGRFSHLIFRVDLGAGAGYSAFQKADDTLRIESVKKMSKLTHRLLCGADYAENAEKRRENFAVLHRELQSLNELELSVGDDVPMVYPLAVRDGSLRQRLIDRKIFIATYWNGQKDEKWGLYFQNYLLPLPIDQRYGVEEMQYIANTIKNMCLKN